MGLTCAVYAVTENQIRTVQDGESSIAELTQQAAQHVDLDKDWAGLAYLLDREYPEPGSLEPALLDFEDAPACEGHAWRSASPDAVACIRENLFFLGEYLGVIGGEEFASLLAQRNALIAAHWERIARHYAPDAMANVYPGSWTPARRESLRSRHDAIYNFLHGLHDREWIVSVLSP